MSIGRNKPCPCGSGKKFKMCCGPAIYKRVHDALDPNVQFRKLRESLERRHHGFSGPTVAIMTESGTQDFVIDGDRPTAEGNLPNKPPDSTDNSLVAGEE